MLILLHQSPEEYYLPTCCVCGKCIYHLQCSGCDIWHRPNESHEINPVVCAEHREM